MVNVEIFLNVRKSFLRLLQNIGELDLDVYLNNKEKTSVRNWNGRNNIFFYICWPSISKIPVLCKKVYLNLRTVRAVNNALHLKQKFNTHITAQFQDIHNIVLLYPYYN